MVKVKKIGSITLFALAAIAVVGLFSSLFTKDSLGSSNGSHKHDFLITNSATCVSPGIETTLCLTCGYMSKSEVGPTEHKYIITETAATCMKEGFTVYDCRICGDHVETVVPSLGHVLENEICKNCGIVVNYDLAYTLIDNGKAYSVSGIGTCSSKDLIIPAYIDGIPVTEIGEKAFLDSPIESIELPATLTVVQAYAFEHSKLNCISLNSGVSEFKTSAFADLDELYRIVIPSNVTVIGTAAFNSCDNLKEVVLSDGLIKIDGFAFAYCWNLVDIIIPGTAERLESGAFQGCDSLKSIVLPSSLNYLGSGIFKFCSNFVNVYFEGTHEQWNSLSKNSGYSDGAGSVFVYFYSESIPSTIGNYWHYVNGVPTLWNE